MAIPNIDHLG